MIELMHGNWVLAKRMWNIFIIVRLYPVQHTQQKWKDNFTSFNKISISFV